MLGPCAYLASFYLTYNTGIKRGKKNIPQGYVCTSMYDNYGSVVKWHSIVVYAQCRELVRKALLVSASSSFVFSFSLSLV